MGGLELSGLESSQIQMRSEASGGCGEICFSQNRYCPLGDGGWVISCSAVLAGQGTITSQPPSSRCP